MKGMKYSYYPGCTLRTKAKDLDEYARASAAALGFELEEIGTGSVVVVFIRLAQTRSPQSFLPSVR